MNLTKQEKKKLRAIFQKAQDLLSMKETHFMEKEKSEYCCFAIDHAEDNGFGEGDEKGTLAYRYFCSLFKPEGMNGCISWPFGDDNEITDKSQDCRLMALQLCELSLT